MPLSEAKSLRAPRRSSAEIAELLVRTGMEIVLVEGPGHGVSNLTFKRVLDRLRDDHGITLAHASIIGRAFADQADYQHAVLSALIRMVGETELDETSAMIVTILRGADRTTLEGRLAANNDVIRLGAFANEKSMQESKTWPIWMALVATEAVRQQPDPTIYEELRSVVARETEDFADLYSRILDYLGLRIRDPYTINHLTIAISAIAEGAVMRQKVLPGLFTNQTMSPRPGEPAQLWSLLGLAIRGISDLMIEPIPNWEPDDTVL
jgi:hypothetical protein